MYSWQGTGGGNREKSTRKDAKIRNQLASENELISQLLTDFMLWDLNVTGPSQIKPSFRNEQVTDSSVVLLLEKKGIYSESNMYDT